MTAIPTSFLARQKTQGTLWLSVSAAVRCRRTQDRRPGGGRLRVESRASFQQDSSELHVK